MQATAVPTCCGPTWWADRIHSCAGSPGATCISGSGFPRRESELKRRALADAGLGPDTAAMAFDGLLADGQADPGAGILRGRVRALEDAEDALGVGGVHANAVVAHGEEPVCPFSNS